MLQPLSAGMHVLQDFPLPVVEAAKLFALQNLDVAVQDREWGLQIVGGRG